MDNPQLEDGYTQIANEILEALAKINMNAYETRALLFVVRKTYGWKKKKDWISLSQFSKGLDLDRRHVFRALKGLEIKGLIVIYRDDKKRPRYGFQKDYTKWKMPDSNKTNLIESKLKRRKKKESAYPDDKVSSIQAPTKETITKETIRKKKEEKTLSISLKDLETSNPAYKEKQALHEWLLREQAQYVKEHSTEDLDKIDWKKFLETYYPGAKAKGKP